MHKARVHHRGLTRAITALSFAMCAACGAPSTPIASSPTVPTVPTPHAPPPSDAGDAGPVDATSVDAAPIDATPSRPPLARETRRPALALGAQHSCLLNAQGEVSCWGANRFGQLGHGSEMGYREFATRPQRVGEGYIQIAGGTWNTCALHEDGQVDCWGHGGFGQLGDEGADSPSPLRMDVDDVVQMAVGGGHICLLRQDSSLWCRGDNTMGQLGHPARVSHSTFERVGVADSVYAGRAHTCIRDGEALSCFGENLDAQLGGGQRSEAEHVPTRIPLVGTPSARFALGGGHSCVLIGGRGHCWGRNDSAQLGNAIAVDDGPTRYVSAPFDVGGAEELALGARFTCALDGGRVQCMGIGHRGQLGDGGRRLRRSWSSVSRLRGVTHIAAGAEHVCAIAAGSVRCWGSGRRGQLGDGDSEDRSRPVRVVGVGREQLASQVLP